MKQHGRVRLAKTLLVCTGISMTSISYAAAFKLFEQNVAAAGNAFAGTAATASNASTEFYNPAGLVRIPNQQVIVGGMAIVVDGKFSGTTSTSVNSPLGTTLLNGPVTGTAQGGNVSAVPDLHYAAPITKRLVVGIGVNAPYGLKTTWDSDSIVRYSQTTTSLRVIDVTPGFGYAVTDFFSVGAGLDAAYVHANFSSMAISSASSTTDHLVRNIGTDTTVGWHGGILVQFTPATRVGLSYHSPLNIRITNGESAFMIDGANAALTGATSYTHDLNGRVQLPPYGELAFSHDIDCQWTVMGGVVFTRWNAIQDIVLNNVNSNGTPITVTSPQNYRNTFAYNLGADYHINNRLTLRGGMMYDRTPVNNIDRNLKLPDANRIWVGTGAHYQATNKLGFDVAWDHLFIHNAGVHNTTVTGSTTVQQLARVDGNVKAHADILGASLTYNIC